MNIISTMINFNCTLESPSKWNASKWIYFPHFRSVEIPTGRRKKQKQKTRTAKEISAIFVTVFWGVVYKTHLKYEEKKIITQVPPVVPFHNFLFRLPNLPLLIVLPSLRCRFSFSLFCIEGCWFFPRRHDVNKSELSIFQKLQGLFSFVHISSAVKQKHSQQSLRTANLLRATINTAHKIGQRVSVSKQMA